MYFVWFSYDGPQEAESSEALVTPSGLIIYRQRPIKEEATNTGEDEMGQVISTAVISEPTPSEQLAMGDKLDLVVLSTEDHEPYDYFPNVIGLS